MGIKQKIQNNYKELSKFKKISIFVILVFLTLYGVVFMIPKNVQFSYAADKTCVKYFTLLPKLQKISSSEDYILSLEGEIRIGKLAVASSIACIKAINEPKEGNVSMSTAPFGGVIFRKNINLNVQNPPKVTDKKFDLIPHNKPISVPMSNTDVVYKYRLQLNDGSTRCNSYDALLRCDLATLGIAQGSSYNIDIERAFNDDKYTTIKTISVTTLTAVSVKAAEIKDGDTVYTKPKQVKYEFDKSIKKAKVTLVNVEEKTSIPIKINTLIEEGTLLVKWNDDLTRSKKFQIKIESVEASDGSNLIEPYVVNFVTSTGPKVKSINIGKSGVSSSATIVVTFDQVLNEQQDINKVTSLKGGSAVISKNQNRIMIQLQGLPKCQDFSLAIVKGLTSEHNVANEEDWNYSSRTLCHTVSTIGSSRGGKSINAYTFGSGGSPVLFTGGIHGNEQSSSLILQDFINDLEINAKSLPVGRQVVVVPTINPDGYSTNSRNNANNVNLNRNFATGDWIKDIRDTNGPIVGGGGESPMSEPETQAIANFTNRLRPRLVLSYHAVGSMSIANQLGDSSQLAANYAAKTGYRNATGQSGSVFEYAISGTYDDWLAEKLGTPSIVIELGSYTYRNFSHHKPAMWAVIGA